MGNPVIKISGKNREIHISDIQLHYAGNKEKHSYELHFTTNHQLSKEEVKAATSAMADVLVSVQR